MSTDSFESLAPVVVSRARTCARADEIIRDANVGRNAAP